MTISISGNLFFFIYSTTLCITQILKNRKTRWQWIMNWRGRVRSECASLSPAKFRKEAPIADNWGDFWPLKTRLRTSRKKKELKRAKVSNSEYQSLRYEEYHWSNYRTSLACTGLYTSIPSVKSGILLLPGLSTQLSFIYCNQFMTYSYDPYFLIIGKFRFHWKQWSV